MDDLGIAARGGEQVAFLIRTNPGDVLPVRRNSEPKGVDPLRTNRLGRTAGNILNVVVHRVPLHCR
jgi:hypothetical protein